MSTNLVDIARMPPLAPRNRPALVSVETANPWFSAAHPEGAGNPRRVPVALRPDAVQSLHIRGALDATQLAAALRLQRLFEILEGGGLRSPDPGRLMMSGRQLEAIGDREVTAGRQLADLRSLLGWRQFELLRCVCQLGLALGELDLGAIGTDRRARAFA